jgi:hypothetical protein
MSIAELQKKIADGEARQVALVGELERSLAIRSLWPDAFKGGSRVAHGWRATHNTIVAEFTRQSDGERRQFTLGELPSCLHPSKKTRAYFAEHFPRARWQKSV